MSVSKIERAVWIAVPYLIDCVLKQSLDSWSSCLTIVLFEFLRARIRGVEKSLSIELMN